MNFIEKEIANVQKELLTATGKAKSDLSLRLIRLELQLKKHLKNK